MGAFKISEKSTTLEGWAYSNHKMFLKLYFTIFTAVGDKIH